MQIQDPVIFKNLIWNIIWQLFHQKILWYFVSLSVYLRHPWFVFEVADKLFIFQNVALPLALPLREDQTQNNLFPGKMKVWRASLNWSRFKEKSFSNNLFRIISIQPSGAAYQTGGLRIGQLIREVDGISLEGDLYQALLTRLALSKKISILWNLAWTVGFCKKSSLF